jgi:hypothetical protein
MATDKQIRANRANAKKSTGPRTPAGRAKCAQNGQSHAWLARTVVIPGESPTRFISVLAQLEEEFDPQTSVEQALVENMATSRWNQLRLMGMQNASIAEEMLNQQASAQTDPNAEPAPHSSASAAAAFRALADQSRATDLLNRYQTRYDNQFHRSFARLTQIREKEAITRQTQITTDESTT